MWKLLRVCGGRVWARLADRACLFAWLRDPQTFRHLLSPRRTFYAVRYVGVVLVALVANLEFIELLLSAV